MYKEVCKIPISHLLEGHPGVKLYMPSQVDVGPLYVKLFLIIDKYLDALKILTNTKYPLVQYIISRSQDF